MTAKYFAILTNQGAARLANAAALGTKLNLTQMAVGDANGVLPTPDPAQTKLINQKRIAPLNLLTVDPANTSQIIAEQIIPENEGGFWIREIGLYDDAGVLIAVANCPETYKPELQEGSGRTQTIRMILIVSSTSAITLKIDPSVVLATRQYVDDKVIEVKSYADGLIRAHEQSRNHPDATTTAKGFTQLNSSVTDDRETQSATPKAVKIAMDNANARLAKERNLSDLTNPALARQNLQLGDSSTKNTGTTANTVAAGDDARITGAMQKSQNGADIQDVAKFLQNLGLVPGIILPEGFNIPAHIVNTPGIVYSAQFPGTYTNEPAFDGEWFDVYAAKHVSDACTLIAVSRTGKIATGSYSANTFSGWNYSLNSSNTTQAGRDLVAKNDATEMAKYLGLDVISGRLLNIVKMTASGTYTPTAGTKSIIVEAIGGGGASGNLTATASNQNAVSAAGSNGAYAKARYTSGFSSVSVTVGAGGIVNGGGGGNGGNGGTTTFGSLLTCPGGSGSTVGIANAPPFNAGAAQPSGSPSGSGIIFSNKGPFSPWPTVVAVGMASNFANCIVPEMGSYGMGGDGVAIDVSSAAKSGNAGTSGCVIVWEYS